MEIKQAWTLSTTDGRVSISGTSQQASKVTIEVTTPGSGYGRSETPEVKASAEVSTDEWREMVRTVESRLIQRGDPQR
jgi:hypothetical protein